VTRVKVEEIVEHLSREFRGAVVDTIREVAPSASFDEHEVFRIFVRKVRSNCGQWENVPKSLVDSR